MTTDPHTQTRPEPDYDLDETMVLLTELQMRDLGKMRQIGLDLLGDLNVRGGDAAKVVQGGLDRAYERICKTMLQVMAMEQHTIKQRGDARATLKTERAKKKKAAVTRDVEAVLDAVAKAPVGKVPLAAAKIAALPRQQRLTLLNDVFRNYDFSDPRTVAVLVAEICRNLGIDFTVAEWPEADVEAEAVMKPSPPAPGPEPDSASSIGQKVQFRTSAKVRGPP